VDFGLLLEGVGTLIGGQISEPSSIELRQRFVYFWLSEPFS